jgi:hypothetical protein
VLEIWRYIGCLCITERNGFSTQAALSSSREIYREENTAAVCSDAARGRKEEHYER